MYLQDAYHPSLESPQQCPRHLPCPGVQKVFAVVLAAPLQQGGPVVQQPGQVVVAAAAAAAAAEVFAELPAVPVVHQQLGEVVVVVAAVALLVVGISLQEYPSDGIRDETIQLIRVNAILCIAFECSGIY